MIPAKQMVSNLINIELSYINTNHPDFIGGSRAVTRAAAVASGGRHDRTGEDDLEADGDLEALTGAKSGSDDDAATSAAGVSKDDLLVGRKMHHRGIAVRIFRHFILAVCFCSHICDCFLFWHPGW